MTCAVFGYLLGIERKQLSVNVAINVYVFWGFGIELDMIFKDPDCTIARGRLASPLQLNTSFIPVEMWFRCIYSQ